VAYRRGCEVRLERCWVEAATAALSVEAGAAPCRVVVEGGSLLAGADGAALCLWSADDGAAAARLELRGATLRGGRALSLRARAGDVQIAATGCVFRFDEAVLGLADASAGAAGVAWRGAGNRYVGGGDWLRPGPGGAPVRGLEGWRRLWGSPEQGSSAAAP
jgi:hypothetical protein